MRFVWITVCFLLVLPLFCADYYITADGVFFRLANTHSFGRISDIAPYSKCFVAPDRDLVIVAVKNPSNLISVVKSPSFCRTGQKIKLKIGEKEMTGKIILTDEQYFEIDIAVRQGNSGTGVFDCESGALLGLVSHYIVENGRQRSRIVRIDNIAFENMEKINAARLLKDWEYFNVVKEYEYKLLQAVNGFAELQSFKHFLEKNPPPLRNHIWKTVFLKKKTGEAENIINNIYKRFAE